MMQDATVLIVSIWSVIVGIKEIHYRFYERVKEETSFWNLMRETL